MDKRHKEKEITLIEKQLSFTQYSTMQLSNSKSSTLDHVSQNPEQNAIGLQEANPPPPQLSRYQHLVTGVGGVCRVIFPLECDH